ncbi:MAG TPA: response regulator [Terriglobales bacterium]|nr:response regulator [Terriglobales bacterium]
MFDRIQNSEVRILYAEDTDAQRYAVSRVLQNAGFQVIEASTGQQALEQMSCRPDLVILDVKLPDISGLEVCRQIKSTEATARVPVLQVSATQVTTRARVEGLEGGADAYLVQPIEPDELIATIHALLRVRKAEDALWESEQQYRSFFEATPLPCLAFGSDLTILAVNAAAVKEYGYSRDEFAAMKLNQIFAPEETDSVDRLFSESDRHSGSSKVYKHIHKGGDSFDVEMISAPLRLNGQSAQLVIIHNVTEKLRRQAAEQQAAIQRLVLDRTLHVQEEERRRIARELHDEAGQLMTSLLVGLRTISDSRRLPEAKKQAKALREIASIAIEELSRLARGLHSSVLDELGLNAAIRRYTQDFAQLHEIECAIDLCPDEASNLSRDAKINIYRIVQEALTNVARHSHATRVSVSLREQSSEMLIAIEDNGCGLEKDPLSPDLSEHLGIESMRQRAAILGGKLEVFSKPQEGLKLMVRIPLQRLPINSRP